MNYIANHKRLVTSRDSAGAICVRVDYLAHKDMLNFYCNEEKAFIVSKRIIYKTPNVIVYTIVVNNIGEVDITTPIVLYSENNGIFTVQKVFNREVVGARLGIDSLKTNQQYRAMFMVKRLGDKEEVLDLIKELTDDTIYGKKILSIFERLTEELQDDKELFLEGIKHSSYVMKYASDRLRKDLDLQKAYVEAIAQAK